MVSIERKLFSLFGNTEDVKQRHPQMDGFNRSFSTMTKEDFARVIEDVRKHMTQNQSVFLTDILGNRYDRYK